MGDRDRNAMVEILPTLTLKGNQQVLLGRIILDCGDVRARSAWD